MAELQTVDAALGVVTIAWQVCSFLKKVKKADKAAGRAYGRVHNLATVVTEIRRALELRQYHNGNSTSAEHKTVESSIQRSLRECTGIIQHIESRLGCSTDRETRESFGFIDRVKHVLKEPSILKHQYDLEINVNALQTLLLLLPIYDHANARNIAYTEHQELKHILSDLEVQLERNQQSLSRFFQKDRLPSEDAVEDIPIDDLSSTSLQILESCNGMAEDIHERLTASHTPDDRSICLQNHHIDNNVPSPPPMDGISSAIASLPFDAETMPSPSALSPLAVFEDYFTTSEDIWPREHLDVFRKRLLERATKAIDDKHYRQAERHLAGAIYYSEIRKQHYDVPFVDQLDLLESLAITYQKQKKWGEALNRASQMIGHASPSPDVTPEEQLTRARSYQLQADIYFERSRENKQNSGGDAGLNDDLDMAEKYGRRAFNIRSKVLLETTSQDVERHDKCVQLLIQVMEANGKGVEARALSGNEQIDVAARQLPNHLAVSTQEHSSHRNPDRDELDSIDHQEALILAIKAGDDLQISALLGTHNGEIDLQRLDTEDKTPLMHAVHHQCDTVLLKLFGADASVNSKNTSGCTALHLAAASGNHDIVQCLLEHDADPNAKDTQKKTPLIKAVGGGHETVVQLLYDNGANLQLCSNNEWSPLHHAIYRSDPSMTSLLLDLDPSLNLVTDRAGKTALHYCAELGFLEQADALLNHSRAAIPCDGDSASRTPLYLAASYPATDRRQKLVELLVDKDALHNQDKPPPRHAEYAVLKSHFQNHRLENSLSKKDTVSTVGTAGTTSTSKSWLTRIFSTSKSR
ncbi:MAG: hypothetical protein M1821_001274 [Bathelium mastoideum]|nr:MAG: hypothetical protein M1821_001274 [Bathelium mastoideum]